MSYKKGKKYGDAFECDIMASINGKIYPLVVVNGNHMLPLNALEPYGPVITYKEEHATHFTSYDTKKMLPFMTQHFANIYLMYWIR